MLTFATTAATAVGVLAACGDSEMSSVFYGAPCTDGDGACGFEDSGFNEDGNGIALYGGPGGFDSGSRADASFIDASEDSGDAGDAGEDAD